MLKKTTVGALVVYTSGRHGDNKNNPVWEGRRGKVIGRIREVKAGSVYVEWSNGCHNVYISEDLEHYSFNQDGALLRITSDYVAPGQEVGYISGLHGDTTSNPLWGGKHGYLYGVIAEFSSPTTAGVLWENGERNTCAIEDLVSKNDLRAIKETFELGKLNTSPQPIKGEIKINEIKETTCELFGPDDKLIGTITSSLQLYDARVQIKKLGIGGFYAKWKDDVIVFNADGRTSRWPAGFFDTFEKLIEQLF